MNFRIEQALLVVDPKGFLFDQVLLEQEKPLSHQQERQKVEEILKSNWTLYRSENIIQLDWAFGKLNQYLTLSVNEYNSFIQKYQPNTKAKLNTLEQELLSVLELLVEVIKRIFFYQIHLYPQKFFKAFSLTSLYLNCDNFQILKLVSDIQLKFLQQQYQSGFAQEEDKLVKNMIAKTLSSPFPFCRSLINLFHKGQIQQDKLVLRLLSRKGETVTINLTDVISNSNDLPIRLAYQSLKLQLNQQDEIMVILYLKIIKQLGNHKQLSYLVELCKNMYLSLEEMASVHEHFWVSIYQDTIQILLLKQPSIVSINQILKYCCSCPEIKQIVGNGNLKEADLLSSLNFALKNTRDQDDKTYIEGQITKIINRFLEQGKWQYAQDIFQMLQICDSEVIDKVFQQYMKVMNHALKEGNVNIFQFEKSFIHFFKFYLSSDNIMSKDYFQKVISRQFISNVSQSFSNTNIKCRRIRHFLFNQSFYFCQTVPGFDEYLASLMQTAQVREMIISIYSMFLRNNECLFKLNFKLIHKMVDNIYSQEKQNDIENIQLCSLYWQTNAKFLLFWGSKSYLEDEIYTTQNYLEHILFKLLELLPSLLTTHKNQQKKLMVYLHNKDKYNSSVLPSWMSLLSYKNKSLSQNLLYICLFLKDILTGYQFKYILDIIMSLYTPLVNITSDSISQIFTSYIEDVEMICSQFALQVLQVVSEIKIPKEMDFNWSRKLGNSFFRDFWKTDRSAFILNLIQYPVTESNYKSLTEIRKIQFYIILYSSVVQRLNPNALKQIPEIKCIQKLLISISHDLEYNLSPIFWEESLKQFYRKSKLFAKEVTEDNSHRLRSIIEKETISKNNSSLGFQRFQITDKYLIFKYFKVLNQLSKSYISHHKKSVQKNLKRIIEFDNTQKDSQFQILATQMQLIHIVEKYCSHPSESEKKLKFTILSPIEVSELEYIQTKMSKLTKLLRENSRSLYSQKLCSLLVRQLNKYFIAYLLHDCISFHHHYSQQDFDNILNSHIKLQGSILAFIKTVTEGCEDSHNVYLQVLDSNISLYLTVIQSQQSQEIKQPLKVYGKQLGQFTLGLIELMFYSTFSLKIRCRSSILHIFINKYQVLTGVVKTQFNFILMSYLKQIFQKFISFSPNENMQKLQSSFSQLKIKMYPIDNLNQIELICTQAMIINLISRINYPQMAEGIASIFSGSAVCFYVQYISIVAEKLSELSNINEADMETLIVDVYGSLENILSKSNDNQENIPRLVAILNKLSKLKVDFKQVRNSIIKYIVRYVIENPKDELFELLQKISYQGDYKFFPNIIQLQNKLQGFRSPLHLLNVLYFDRNNFKNIRLNWALILQNNEENEIHQMISKITNREHQELFVKDYSMESEIVDELLNKFVNTTLEYFNQKKTITDLYSLSELIIAVAIKFPSLIDQIFKYKINTKSLKSIYNKVPYFWRAQTSQQQNFITFLQFVLDLAQVNPRLINEFTLLILRTNSGFKYNKEELLISNNLIYSIHFKNIIIHRLSLLFKFKEDSSRSLSIFGMLKALQCIIRQSQAGLFKLYTFTSPPRECLLQYFSELSKPFLNSICTLVINNFEASKNTLLQETMIRLLGQTLAQTLSKYEIDSEAEDNIKYYLNNYLFSVLKGCTQYQWNKIEVEDYHIELKNTEFEKYKSEVSVRKYHNTFLSKEYSVVKQDQFNDFQSENQRILSKIKLLGFGEEIFKVQESIKCLNTLTLEHQQLFDFEHRLSSYDQTKYKTTCSQAMNSPSTSHLNTNNSREHQCGDNFMLMEEDEFLQDDIIDETKQQKVSSFGQLMSGISDTAVKQLIRRVNKLQIMDDLEHGKEISHKLQFLSNQQLLKLSTIAEGKLLLEIEHQKQFRGFAPLKHKYGKIEFDEAVRYRYLNELYPGCRKLGFVQLLAESKKSIIPALPQSCLLKTFQMFIQSYNDQKCHKSTLKTIHILSLHPANLKFFANSIYFMISIKQSELPTLKQWFGWATLEMVKSCAYQLLSHFFEHKIGLTLWLLGQINIKSLSLNKLEVPDYLQKISYRINRNEVHVRLIELIASNINLRKNDQHLLEFLELYKNYLEEREGRYAVDYPWFDTPQVNLSSDTVIDELIVEIVRRRKRMNQGSVLQILLKLLLKVYPSCYQPFMLHFFHETSIEAKKVIEWQSATFKRFTVINSLNPDSIQQMNLNQEMLIKLVQSYMSFTLQKSSSDHILKQTSYYLKDIYNDVCLGVVPWFKEWRFKVQNREELTKHYQFIKQIKEKITSAKTVRDYKLLEELELQLRKLDHRLLDWKSEHKNEFLKSYIKPIHECFSTNLVMSFKKSVDLMEETAQLFSTIKDKFMVVEPVYRSQSVVWQTILAYTSIYLQDSTNSYHSMSKLSTREHLRQVEQYNRRRSRKSKKSIRMSIVHKINSNLGNISLMMRLGSKISLVGYYLKEGSTLIKTLAHYGSLDIKLKSIKRKKSGVIKEIEIDRSKIWFDSIMNIDSEFIQKDIRIKFKGEIGIDYGGLTKEWLTSITQELFNPNFGLFELSANKLSIQPSRFSFVVPQHLMHFRKLGLLVGKALVEDWALQINFTRSFLKHLLGNTLYVQDMFDIDPDTAKSLIWILQNDVSQDLGINYCIQDSHLGVRSITPLIQNGQNIMVTQQNKKQYVKAVCRYKMTQQIRPQAKAFMDGLEEVVSYDILRCMNHKELGLYFSGMPKINVQQMKQYAKYNNFTENEEAVVWFWQTLQEYNQENLANFLFFVSGSFKVPYGGFKEYPLIVNRGFVVEHLPVAHTCFNTLDLPAYTSKSDLQKKLGLAIKQGKGFGVS